MFEKYSSLLIMDKVLTQLRDREATITFKRVAAGGMPSTTITFPDTDRACYPDDCPNISEVFESLLNNEEYWRLLGGLDD